MNSSKLPDIEVHKENVSQPKWAQWKLDTNGNSCPIDISSQVILRDHKVKESDHLIVLM